MNGAKRFETYRMFFAIVIALLVSFAIIFCISDEPVKAIVTMITGPLASKRNFGNVIESMIPLMFTGTGVCIMFAANQINLATDGGFQLGGLVAAAAVIHMGLPSGIALILSMVVGALFCMIPAILKIKTGSNEMVCSLMLNYVSLWFCTYILMNFMLDESVGAASYKMPKASELLTLVRGTNVHIGFIIALVGVAIGYIFLYKSRIGYELRITGENELFARYSGINVVRVILISQLVGGIFAGLGGGVEILSPVYARFSWLALLGYGWDAIIICTLAKNNPIKVPLAALFLAYLRTGASIMSRATDVTLEIVQITQGIIIMLVVAEQFLSKMRHRMIAKEAKASLKEEEVA